MIETTVYGFLKGELDVPVYLEKPANPPKKYVFLERTSGGENNHINSATFAIQSYGATLYDAALLNDTVKIALLGNDDALGIVDQNEIYSCKLQTDYNYTDISKKRIPVSGCI